MEENAPAPSPDLSESSLSKQRRTTWRRETRGLVLLYGVFVLLNLVIATYCAGGGPK